MTNQKDHILYHGCQCTHSSCLELYVQDIMCLTWASWRLGCYLQSHDTTKYMRPRITLQYHAMMLPFRNALQFFWTYFINDTAQQGTMQTSSVSEAAHTSSYLLECSPYQSQSILSSPLPNFYWQKLCGEKNSQFKTNVIDI